MIGNTILSQILQKEVVKGAMMCST